MFQAQVEEDRLVAAENTEMEPEIGLWPLTATGWIAPMRNENNQKSQL